MGPYQVAEVVKNPPANARHRQEMQIWYLGKENLWRRKWQPMPVFLPGKSHGQRSLMGYCPWDLEESDMTETTEHILTGYTVNTVYLQYLHMLLSYSLWAYQFSSVLSLCLQPHEPQHARPPCSSPTPRVHPNPCPLSHGHGDVIHTRLLEKPYPWLDGPLCTK